MGCKQFGTTQDYKMHALEAARDFGYGEDVIRQINEAKTDDQISGIMRRARLERMKK